MRGLNNQIPVASARMLDIPGHVDQVHRVTKGSREGTCSNEADGCRHIAKIYLKKWQRTKRWHRKIRVYIKLSGSWCCKHLRFDHLLNAGLKVKIKAIQCMIPSCRSTETERVSGSQGLRRVMRRDDSRITGFFLTWGKYSVQRVSDGCSGKSNKFRVALKNLSLLAAPGFVPVFGVLVRLSGVLFSCGAQASHSSGFSCCRARALGCAGFRTCGSQALEHKKFSGCSPQA